MGAKSNYFECVKINEDGGRGQQAQGANATRFALWIVGNVKSIGRLQSPVRSVVVRVLPFTNREGSLTIESLLTGLLAKNFGAFSRVYKSWKC